MGHLRAVNRPYGGWAALGTPVERVARPGFGPHVDAALSAASTVGQTGTMGFNPHIKSDKTPDDYLLVVVALIVCAGLVIWGILG